MQKLTIHANKASDVVDICKLWPEAINAEVRNIKAPPLPCADCAGMGEHLRPSCTE